jgi:hypothetical protein
MRIRKDQQDTPPTILSEGNDATAYIRKRKIRRNRTGLYPLALDAALHQTIRCSVIGGPIQMHCCFLKEVFLSLH